MRIFFCLLGMLCWKNTELLAQNAHQQLRTGDKQYLKENYTAAEQRYQDAVKQNPGSLNATYNLGCAEYQQGKLPEAEKAFQQAVAGAQLPATKADALYNLGNAQLKQHKFKEAIEAYENSLRLQPGDAAAKQNLQMAKQQQKEEQKQQQQQKQQQEQQNGNGQQPPNDQKQPPQDQSKQPQEQPQQNNGQPQKADKKPGQDQQSSPTEPGKMTKEDAQRMLETTIGPEDRKNARKYRASVQNKKVPKTNKKDW